MRTTGTPGSRSLRARHTERPSCAERTTSRRIADGRWWSAGAAGAAGGKLEERAAHRAPARRARLLAPEGLREGGPELAGGEALGAGEGPGVAPRLAAAGGNRHRGVQVAQHLGLAAEGEQG